MSSAGTNAGLSRRGFSLLELLVVLGLVGGFGTYALTLAARDSGAFELAVAEAQVGQLLTQARQYAIDTYEPVRVVVCIEAVGADGVGSRLALMRRSVQQSGEWEIFGRTPPLPSGVGIVPSSGVGGALPEAWPADGFSRFDGILAVVSEGVPSGQYGYVHFAAGGTTFGSPRLILAICRRTVTGPVFERPTELRRFQLRASGTHTVIRG